MEATDNETSQTESLLYSRDYRRPEYNRFIDIAAMRRWLACTHINMIKEETHEMS